MTIKCAVTIFLAWSFFLVTCELSGCVDSSEIDKQSAIHTPQSEAVKPPNSSSASGPIAVRVCSMSATGTPCSPQAGIFADRQFTLPKLSTGLDADGMYHFYAKPGMYLLEISGDGFAAQHFSVAVPPTASGAASEAQVTVHTNSTGVDVTFSGGLLLPGVSSQTAPSPATQSPPTSTTVNLVSGGDGSAQSPASGQLFVGRVYPVVPTPVLGAGQPIQWVAYNGNDASDGSLGSPKATVMAAYDALPPTGGTINISEGLNGNSIPESSTPGVGIWIVGPWDPNYKTPPPGARQFKPNVSFVGIAATSNQPNSHSAGQVQLVTVGSGQSQPCIELSGFGGPMFFQNLKCLPAPRGVVIGEASNGLRDGSGYVANVTFQNVAAYPIQSATTGPGIDITGNSFWLYFYDCNFDGNWDAPVMDNKRAAMLIDGTGNLGNYLIFVTNLNTNGGGIKFIPGQNGGGLVVNGMTEEGSFSGTPVPPGVYVTYTNDYTSFHFENIQVADGSATGTDAVLIGGNGPSEAVLVDGYTSGSGGGVVGPATVMGQYPNAVANTPQSPASMGQVGFFDGYVVGQTDVARRNFGPVAIRFPNIAAQVPGSWVLDHDVTVQSGIPAPDGTNGAGQANVSVAVQESVNFFANNQTSIAVGDYFIGGTWLRSLSPTGGYSGLATTAIFLNLRNGNVASGETQGAVSSGENEWTWQWFVYKLTTVGTPVPYITFGAYCDLTHPIQAYAPVLMHIPAGTVSDNEAYQIATNLAAFPDGLPAGTVATLRGQTFAFGGTGDYFGLLTQANTANRTYQFPDASGTVPLLNIPQTWTAPQTLPSAVLTDPIINGQQLDSPVVATYTAILPGALTNAYTASTFTLDYGIVVLRVEITLKTAPEGCGSGAVVSLNGSTDLEVPVNAVMSDSGPVTIPMNVGTPLQVVLSAPAQGCSIPPQDANVVVHYHMQ